VSCKSLRLGVIYFCGRYRQECVRRGLGSPSWREHVVRQRVPTPSFFERRVSQTSGDGARAWIDLNSKADSITLPSCMCASSKFCPFLPHAKDGYSRTLGHVKKQCFTENMLRWRAGEKAAVEDSTADLPLSQGLLPQQRPERCNICQCHRVYF
jgi:hypothetical protein